MGNFDGIIFSLPSPIYIFQLTLPVWFADLKVCPKIVSWSLLQKCPDTFHAVDSSSTLLKVSKKLSSVSNFVLSIFAVIVIPTTEYCFESLVSKSIFLFNNDVSSLCRKFIRCLIMSDIKRNLACLTFIAQNLLSQPFYLFQTNYRLSTACTYYFIMHILGQNFVPEKWANSFWAGRLVRFLNEKILVLGELCRNSEIPVKRAISSPYVRLISMR